VCAQTSPLTKAAIVGVEARLGSGSSRMFSRHNPAWRERAVTQLTPRPPRPQITGDRSNRSGKTPHRPRTRWGRKAYPTESVFVLRCFRRMAVYRAGGHKKRDSDLITTALEKHESVASSIKNSTLPGRRPYGSLLTMSTARRERAASEER